MHFQNCWEYRNCSRQCHVSERGILFCWRAQSREHPLQIDRCATCDYRSRWIEGEYSVLECIQRFGRRRKPRSKPRVLVVDDEPYIRYALEETVTAEGFECMPADDGEEGLFLARETKPDLVISDVIMPKVSGYDLCHSIKTRGRTRHIPVILITVRGTEDDICHGEKAGADAYLVKPFRARQLADLMASFLTRDGERIPRHGRAHAGRKEGEELTC